MPTRKKEGRETWNALLEWDKGQAPSERLSTAIVLAEGYTGVDPSHPLGGKDGGKDILLKKDGLPMVGAVYFPRGKQTITKIKKKFKEDLKGVEKNKARGIVFLTNQELKLGQRNQLQKLGGDTIVEIYHLERIASLLNSPSFYGIRTEFLDIDMTNSELVALYAQRDKAHLEQLQSLSKQLNKAVTDLAGFASGGDSYPYHFIVKGADGKLQLVTNVTGKFPLYEVKIDFQIRDTSTNPHLAMFSMATRGKRFSHPALTDYYAQQITEFSRPTTFPIEFIIMTYARNGVFNQTLEMLIDEDTGVIYCRNILIHRVKGGTKELIVKMPDQKNGRIQKV